MHQSSMAENCNKIQTVGEVNDVTSSEDEDEDDEDDEDEDLDEIKSDDENLASPFNEQNIVLVFDERKLFLQREHLIAVSPVFETMFSSKFPEGSMKEIPLPDKKHSHFVHFLRYLSPGFEDVLTEATVHHMLPLAEEYQTDDLKLRIEKFLIKGVLSQSDSITSVQIIVNIIEAEKYKLNGYLNACIDVASRKKKLTKNPKFEEISQSTQLKIGLKRIDEIDKIYSNASYRRSVKHNKFQMKDLGKHLKPYMQDN
ncbi:BTB and MATH domain-containing protein 36-like [Mytilus edulis]|uniref:BTB and MATH domain-containing protein 36-like n=1 Tax=Mytilus edulis TaxID=6550 RepID=UPI0039EFCD42